MSTEQLPDLLVRAAAGISPRTADPVGQVAVRVRRDRRRRTLRAGLVGVAVLALTVGGVVALRPKDVAPPVPAASPTRPVTVPASGGPVVPKLVDGVVVAAGFRMPVPAGWQTIEGREQEACTTPPHTLLVNGRLLPGPYCEDHQGPYITVQPLEFHWGPRGGFVVTQEVPLAGGQPAWLVKTTLDRLSGVDYRSVTLLLPWSGVSVALSGPGGELATIIGTIQTQPVTPERLRLPAQVTEIQFSDGSRLRGWVGKPEKIQPLLPKLAELDQVVTDDEACPAGPITATITLIDANHRLSVITIRSNGDCAQATSSLGGRVRLPDNFLADFTNLIRAAEQ